MVYKNIDKHWKVRLGLVLLLTGSILINFGQWWYFKNSLIKELENDNHLIDTRQFLFDALQGKMSMNDLIFALNEMGQKNQQDSSLQGILQSLNGSFPSYNQGGAEYFNDKAGQQQERSREFLTRISALSQEYQAILKDNLVLKDSIYQLRIQSLAKDAKFDSMRYVLNEKLDNYEKSQQKFPESAITSSVLIFKSPSGVNIYYFGEINNEDMAHGQGFAIYANGNSYEGSWQHGKKDGNGKYRFSDGESYIGNFKQDKRHGLGSYLRKNGESYRGFWVNDLREGEGQILDKKGKVIKSGIWKQDKFIQEKLIEYVED
jgi:hypothetical protein